MLSSAKQRTIVLPPNGARSALAAGRFLLGGLAYCGLEVAYRGYTHPSMAVVGGLCFVLLCLLAQTRLSLISCALLGGLGVTAVELAAGAALNLWLKLGVWDYSRQPFNLFGQVCLSFTLLWILLSGAVVFLARAVTAQIKRNRIR